MITENDNDILEKLDPNSLLTEDKLEMLGWKFSHFQNNKYCYCLKGRQSVNEPTLIESWKVNEWSVSTRNGYSFHYKSWVSHCWTVAELIDVMERCNILL